MQKSPAFAFVHSVYMENTATAI